MPTLWFILVAFMVAMYVLLDGFDLGTGIVHWGVGRSEEDRTLNLRAIGPVWDGNEVWLLAGGGALYFAFPPLYAAGFSGFYLPLMMVLWCLILRGISIEVRSHIDDRLWRSFFDAVFTFASVLLAIFLGAALGNVVRGVPINDEGYFFLPLWTDFRVSANPGVLDWYTILTGLVAFFGLALHGSLYLALKTEGEMNARARRIAGTAWWAVLLLTLVAAPATLSVRPQIGVNYLDRWWGFALPALALGGLIFLRASLSRGRDLAAFLGSCTYLAGALGGAVFGLYPVILPAVGNEKNTLTIYNSATGDYGLSVGLIWWSIGILLAGYYFVHLYRMFQGKVSSEGAGY